MSKWERIRVNRDEMKKTARDGNGKMKILKGIGIRGTMAGLVGIFKDEKDPMDEKLIAMPCEQAFAPGLTLAAEPVLAPRLTLVPDLAPSIKRRKASRPLVAPKLSIVRNRGMEAALRLSAEMLTQIHINTK